MTATLTGNTEVVPQSEPNPGWCAGCNPDNCSGCAPTDPKGPVIGEKWR